MPVPANISILSTTAALNSPPGSETPALTDDYLRTGFAFIAELRDRAASGVAFTPTGSIAATNVQAAIAELDNNGGAFTPTIVNVSNGTAISVGAAQFMRCGGVCTVSGRVTVSAIALGNIRLGISLPVAANFVSNAQCAGTAVSSSGDAVVAAVYGDTANDRAELRTEATSETGITLFYQFTYVI